MLVDKELAADFLYKYQMIMVYLNHGVIPNGTEGFAEIRPEIYDCLDEIDGAMSETVGPDFISSLRKAVYGEFVYLKKYKDGYAFKHLESGFFYHVSALTTPLEAMLSEFIVVNTALVPWGDKIICDGLVTEGSTRLGKSIIKEIRDSYLQAQNNGTLQEQFMAI